MGVRTGAGARTRLADLYQSGCAKLRLPRTNARHVEAVAINTSGGLTGGDILDWSFEAGKGASLAATTQACERVYRSAEGSAEVVTRLRAGPGARLAWLPQETILYDGAALSRRLELDMSPDARVLLLEPIVFGRAAMGERVRSLRLRDDWRVCRGGALVHAEAVRLDGDAEATLRRAHVAGAAAAMATLVLLSPDADASATRIGDAMGGITDCEAAVARFPDRLAVRLLARDARALRTTLLPLIEALSPVAGVPRVWRL